MRHDIYFSLFYLKYLYVNIPALPPGSFNCMEGPPPPPAPEAPARPNHSKGGGSLHPLSMMAGGYPHTPPPLLLAGPFTTDRPTTGAYMTPRVRQGGYPHTPPPTHAKGVTPLRKIFGWGEVPPTPLPGIE